MRGLFKAAALLAPALATSRSVKREDDAPSAFIRLDVPHAEDDSVKLQTTLRLSVIESEESCGYGNVLLNGQALSQDGDGLGSGSISTEQGSLLIANWKFACVDLDDVHKEQTLAVHVDFVDGKEVNDMDFTVQFQQKGPVWVTYIEGADSIITAPKLEFFPEEHQAAEFNTEFQAEISELEAMKMQLVELEQAIFMKELFLAEAFGFRGSKGSKLTECDSLKCIAKSMYDSVKGVASKFYGHGMGEDGLFGGPHHGHHRGEHGDHHMGPHGGPGKHHGPPGFPFPHHGNQTHGNHTHPPPPPHGRPDFPPPPFCHCPPPPPPHGHHGPPDGPHGPPPHHGPEEHHGPPHDGPHHGPGKGPEKGPAGKDGEDRPDFGHHHGPPPPPPPPPPFDDVEDHPRHPSGDFPPPPPPPPFHGPEGHHGDHGDDMPPPPPPHGHPEDGPHGDSPPPPPPFDHHEDGPHGDFPPPPPPFEDGPDGPEHPLAGEGDMPPPPPEGPHGHGGPHGHRGPPPFHVMPFVRISAVVVTLGLLFAALHTRCFTVRRGDRSSSCISRRRNHRASRRTGFAGLVDRIMGRNDGDDEEKEAMMRHVGEEDSESDAMSTTMEQDIEQFRNAANVVSDMVAAEEGRSVQSEMVHYSSSIPPPSPHTAFPDYMSVDEALPSYDEAGSSDSAYVSDGMRPSDSAFVSDGMRPSDETDETYVSDGMRFTPSSTYAPSVSSAHSSLDENLGRKA